MGKFKKFIKMLTHKFSKSRNDYSLYYEKIFNECNRKLLDELYIRINKSPLKLWFIAQQAGYKPPQFVNILTGRRRPKNKDFKKFIERVQNVINRKIR